MGARDLDACLSIYSTSLCGTVSTTLDTDIMKVNKDTFPHPENLSLEKTHKCHRAVRIVLEIRVSQCS